MNGRFLLDTNIVLALFAGDDDVVEQIEAAEELFIPSIVIGELYYGARKSNRAKENLAQVEDFADANTILPCTAETGRWYGILKDLLRQKNAPIPENDIWLAALALEHGLVLVTRDAQFQEITNLKTVAW